ncbi:hypothetical protein FISHEDRAFT_21563, partial [Fistulina hepatica ATCC 64428]
CVPFGVCEPCPDDALHEPFCQPFGNRRLLHCNVAEPASSHNTVAHSLLGTDSGTHEHEAGETLAWESCGRVVVKERVDFYEFIVCNAFFAIIAVALTYLRLKRLEQRKSRQVAARITRAR